MKVVIFCGGLGVRMGEETKRIPKPMIQIGDRPILWHIMRYYAAFGHTEFVLCLGYKGEVVKDYFLSHQGALLNDFSLERRGAETSLELLPGAADDWKITFVDTGADTTIAGRLKAVEQHLASEETFLATYGDGLTDANLDEVVDAFRARGKIAMFLLVRPQFNAHLVETDANGTVVSVADMSTSSVRINGGFFVFRRELLDWIEPGDELVEETFARLIARREVVAFAHDGFFGPMDTIKDQQRLDELYRSGAAPWHNPKLGAAEVPGLRQDTSAEPVLG
jgi:glucose-1-phosphate cytidylyltransferase